MAKKNKKLDTAVKVTQASKFFSFTDGELAEAQSVIAKDEDKKKKALEKEKKERIKAEDAKNGRILRSSEEAILKFDKKIQDELKRRQAEELDLLDKLFEEK